MHPVVFVSQLAHQTSPQAVVGLSNQVRETLAKSIKSVIHESLLAVEVML